MIKNYLKTAWRNLWKNKVFSAINILGLALGLACSLLILLWVQNEIAVDAFHKNGPYLYTVYERTFNDHKVSGQYYTPGILAAELKKDIPEIKYAANFSYNEEYNFKVGDKVLKMDGTSTDVDFFKMFSYKLLQGNAQTALNSPVSLAISRKMAESFFGSAQAAIGKTILFDNRKNFTVTAVFENLPQNVSAKFDYLTNWNCFLEDNPWAKQWNANGPSCYIQLRADANPSLVEKKITHFLDTYVKNQQKGTPNTELGLQRFDEGYLHSNFENGKFEGGRIEYVHLFSIVSIFILLIACINFMNLTTARSVKRAREIGVRKVVGAVRSVLIKQFIGESLLFTAFAVIVSLAFVICLLPLFNAVTQKQIALPFNEGSFWLKLVIITFITGLVSGMYPALFLSSFNPVRILKGTIKLGSGTATFRKGLVIFQFVLSVVLIISTIIVSRQINYIQSVNLGYDRENLVYIPLEGDLVPKYNVFKNEALQLTGVKAMSRMSSMPTTIYVGTNSVSWEGKDPNSNVEFTFASVGYDFVRTMKLQMAAGRDFSRDFQSDSSGYLINEAALAKIGYTDPIGKPLVYSGKRGRIIGVVKDFHFTSLHYQINPIIIWLREKSSFGYALVRTQPGKTKEALAGIETLCRKLNPNFAFTYTFSDEEYQKLYDNEQVIGKLSNVFAALAILISCLGLLGLAIFTAEQRLREISVRKVLGASVSSLFTLLSSEFLMMVFISLVIASPVAWYAMHKWLQNYAYHTKIEWWVFVFAGLIAILITLITVSFQAIKAALANPVKSLRSE